MNDSDSSGQDQEPLAATAAAPPEPLSSSMHQVEEPGQPLAVVLFNIKCQVALEINLIYLSFAILWIHAGRGYSCALAI